MNGVKKNTTFVKLEFKNKSTPVDHKNVKLIFGKSDENSNNEFSFGSILDYNLNVKSKYSIDLTFSCPPNNKSNKIELTFNKICNRFKGYEFGFGSTLDYNLKYNKNYKQDIVFACPHIEGNNINIIFGQNCRSPKINLDGTFSFGSELNVIFNEPTEFGFGSTLQYFLTQRFEPTYVYGTAVDVKLDVKRNVTKWFYSGSTLEYKFAEHTLLEDNSFTFGSSVEYEFIEPFKFAFGSAFEFDFTLRIRNSFPFGSALNHDIHVEKDVTKWFYSGSELTYQFAEHTLLEDNSFEFGSELKYGWLNRPAKFISKFSWGVYLEYDNPVRYIDLVKSCQGLYPINVNDLDIDYSIEEPLFDWKSWIVFNGGLTFRPRNPQYEFSFGSTLEKPVKPTLKGSFAFGGVFKHDDFSRYYIVDNLCPTAFVGTGENVIMDYNEPYGGLCRNWAFSTGIELQNKNLHVEKYSGYTALWGVTCNIQLTVTRNHYEFLWGSLFTYPVQQKFRPIFNWGSVVNYSIYLPPTEFITGSTLNYNLKFIYNIEFLEKGCLDNDHIPTDSNGNVIPELIRAQTLEGDYFDHVIKTRIYL